ncbi:MAG: hypothetical protein KHY46_13860 [Clostridiales bacterium]|nr:hypothetical protein [Clostridiales bacterium]
MSRPSTSGHRRGLTGIIIMAVLSLAVIAVSNPIYQALKGPVTLNQPEFPLADGTYTYEASEPDDSGYRDVVSITVTDGIIVACSWDSLDSDGNGKQKLSMEGQYVMTEDGPTWKAQSDALSQYVIEHQNINSLANEQGYAMDTISSVSINVYPFINAFEECLKLAAK